MSLGSFTHTSLDGYATTVTYTMDDGYLYRQTVVKASGPHIDPKTDSLDVTGQSSAADALAQIEAYKQCAKNLSGDSPDEIKAKIIAADPKKTEAELKVVEAAAAVVYADY